MTLVISWVDKLFKRRLLKLGIWLLIFLGLASLYILPSRLQEARREFTRALAPQVLLPRFTALKLLSLGYKNVVADYYWLKAISHFGDRTAHKQHYPYLAPFLTRVLFLDPYFLDAYLFAGNALTLFPEPENRQTARKLLEQGASYCPHSWKLLFLQGFTSFYFFHDHLAGAKALAAAALLPATPPYVGLLATRLAAAAAHPEVGLELVEVLLRGESRPEFSKVYAERRNLLLLEIHLRQLTAALELFKQQTGRIPSKLEELSAAGLVAPEILREPPGAEYYIDEQARVGTKLERLHLAPLFMDKQ